MKKILAIILMFFFSAEVNAKRYKVNDVIENQFVMNKKFQLNLPEGKWTVVRSHGSNYYGLASKIYVLVRLENNLLVEYIEIAEIKTAGVYEDLVNQAIYEAIFKNKYDGCYERPEYSVLEFYAKGSSHNCFTVGHQDLVKDIYDPDDPELKTAYSQLKVWLKNRSIELPKIALYSSHSYFSRLSMGKWLTLGYLVDPKVLNAPKNKFLTEESSEYHKYNINNYPEHNEIMKKWISISAERHVNFEKSIKVIKRHLLDLDQYYLAEPSSNNRLSNNAIEQIKKLNDLYKDGILTKEEFKKAKKKILN